MRMTLSLVATLVLSIAPALADRNISVFTSAGWQGAAHYDEDGRFVFCSMRAGYQNGMFVTFGLWPNGQWSVGFDRPAGFSNKIQQRLDLYIDGRFVFGAPAAGDGKMLILNLPSTTELFQGMRNGYGLKVVTPGGSADFSLTGSAVGLTQLAVCATQYSAPQITNKQTPYVGQEREKRAQSIENAKFPREQVLTYAANVLAAANITGYKFLPYEDTKFLGDVAWGAPDGTLGAIIMMKAPVGLLDLDQLTAQISQRDGKECKGDFMSGKKAPRYVNSVEVRKFFTLCRAAGDSTQLEYSFLMLPQGVYIRHVSVRFGEAALSGDGDASTIQRSEDALLKVSLPE